MELTRDKSEIDMVKRPRPDEWDIEIDDDEAEGELSPRMIKIIENAMEQIESGDCVSFDNVSDLIKFLNDDERRKPELPA